ncbi:cysteine-rich CWC family protein [Vibrio zhugei]|uniref:Cysteine-rich CWC family protein n=1 Tax=Vibrio zhugei TaxID=2479546 RepID=A0ABV7C943_9VIBR|nr:cysteine-rich CWC family protein [Vibrio zhugei]
MTIQTPCRAACKNDGGLCSGCYRTMPEILAWQHYSSAERQAIMNELNGIKHTHSCPACQQLTFCGRAAGQDSCWCLSVEEREPLTLTSQACLCRACLSQQPER